MGTPSRNNNNNNNNNNNHDKKMDANLPGGGKKKAFNPDAIQTLQLFGQSERINIDCNANKHLNIASSIRAVEETGKEDERLPVEIAIALDVSGSMHGEKIQLCKETIELLSKYLLPKDKLSITTFDTDVKQIFQLSEMTSQNKQNVEAVIKNVKAGSSTNLSGVLKQSNVKNNVVKACILLTDGHANHGVRDMSK